MKEKLPNKAHWPQQCLLGRWSCSQNQTKSSFANLHTIYYIFYFFRLGTFGAIIEYGIERKITKQSTLAATMSVGAVGVVLKIRLNRASQTYNFPIHLSDEILFQPLFYGTVTPMIAWYVLKKLILEPWEAKESKKVEKQHKMEETAR